MRKHINEIYEKSLKEAFITECSEMVTKHLKYKPWEEEISHIPSVTLASQEEANSFAITKMVNFETYQETQQSSEKQILKIKHVELPYTQTGTFQTVRERLTGSYIYEAERTVFIPPRRWSPCLF